MGTDTRVPSVGTSSVATAPPARLSLTKRQGRETAYLLLQVPHVAQVEAGAFGQREDDEGSDQQELVVLRQQVVLERGHSLVPCPLPIATHHLCPMPSFPPPVLPAQHCPLCPPSLTFPARQA